MKIFKATTAYSSYLNQFFQKNKNLSSKSYTEQSSFLFYDAFGWADFWEKSLAPLGWSVFEVVANAKSIQTTWAKEKGWQIPTKNWVPDILARQILLYQPEILFLEDHTLLTAIEIKELREKCKSIRLVVSWCGAPYKNTNFFSQHDLVLSCVPEIVARLNNLGCKSERMDHAFYPGILQFTESIKKPTISMSFVGQIVPGSQQHLGRARMLAAISKSKLPLEIYTPSHTWSCNDRIKSCLANIVLSTAPIPKNIRNKDDKNAIVPLIRKIKKWQGSKQLPDYHQLVSHFRKPVFGQEMYKTIRNSQITFNCHIDISKKSASNMRLFEATGVGSCLLTDAKDDLNRLFESDYEVVTYASKEECVEKATWLLANPDKRQVIAKAGQERTLKYHTFDKRAIELIEILKRYL
jgi:spore maturation protein CgeB